MDMTGQVLGPSEWVEVTQDMINEYAHAVRDEFWIHVDVEKATKEFGGTIAHGLLVLSIAQPLVGEVVKFHGVVDLVYGYDKIRFLSVVHGGDRIRAFAEVVEVAPRGNGHVARTKVTVEVEGKSKPAVIAEWLIILFDEPKELARQAKVGADAAGSA